MVTNSYNTINMCTPCGDKLSFKVKVGLIFTIVSMYINDAFSCSKIFSGNMRTDINLMMLQRYEE